MIAKAAMNSLGNQSPHTKQEVEGNEQVSDQYTTKERKNKALWSYS